MADIINASSGYQTGSIDTATTLVNNVSPTDAKHINYPAGAIIQIETILGSGTTLKGSTADLATRLAVGLDSGGLLKLSTDASITGPLNVAKGGTGVATLADGAVLVGNTTGAVQALALPSAGRTLIHSGTAAADPAWGTGLLYHGPTSCGTGSTRSHEGTVVVSSNGNYSGIHYYTDFTLNSSTTMTIPAGSGRLIIIATGTITINGTITGAGGGFNAGGAIGAAGGIGTDQPGGASGNGNVGGSVVVNGFTLQAGGAGAGTQLTGSSVALICNPFMAFGGASGAGSDSVTGGRGGASIILIAPTVVLAATSTLNTSGSAGSGAAPFGNAAGGGGAGNIYIWTRSYTDNGCTFTLTGGAGGGVDSGNNGYAGATGVKQILIYA